MDSFKNYQMKLYLLSTCDAWKSRGGMRPYYIGRSSKAGTRRLAKVIAAGVTDGTFEYCNHGGGRPVAEQKRQLYNDLAQGCTSFYYALRVNLQFGDVTLIDCDAFC